MKYTLEQAIEDFKPDLSRENYCNLHQQLNKGFELLKLEFYASITEKQYQKLGSSKTYQEQINILRMISRSRKIHELCDLFEDYLSVKQRFEYLYQKGFGIPETKHLRSIK